MHVFYAGFDLRVFSTVINRQFVLFHVELEEKLASACVDIVKFATITLIRGYPDKVFSELDHAEIL